MNDETLATNFGAPGDWTLAGLRAAGFQGFRTFAELRIDKPPTSAGIYVVVRPSLTRPVFSTSSPAGRSRDFTEPLALLTGKWVDGCQVLYIGLARSGLRRTGLRRRLGQFRRTGAGTAGNHAGGVWVFQLEDAADLRVCWRASSDSAEGAVVAEERALIADFRSTAGAGRRPFANRRD